MFTGIIQYRGTVVALAPKKDGTQLSVRVPAKIAKILTIGGSMAVNGVCLSVVQKRGALLTFELMEETLHVTTLGALRKGARVNMELPLREGDPLGGHLVQGHVDGVGMVVAQGKAKGATVWTILAPEELGKYIANKGSVALNGVSLTVNNVNTALGCFQVSLLAQTLKTTTLGTTKEGDKVNIEVDVLAKYAQHRCDSH